MKRLFTLVCMATCMMAVAAADAQEASAPQPRNASYSLNVPFFFDMTTEGEFGMLTTLDANGDGMTWHYNSSALQAPWSKRKDGKYTDCNDWVWLPAINFFNVDKQYQLTFNMWSNMARNSATGSYPHSDLDVWIGTAATPDSMKQKIFETKDFSNYAGRNGEDTVRQKATFGVPGKAGTYYIGFHCGTKYDDSQWQYWINHIAVDETTGSVAAPKKVIDAVITPGDSGALKANVKFTMPTVDMANNALPTDKNLTATVKSPVETITLQKKPGEQFDSDIRTLQGNNHLTIQVDGDIEGDTVGYDVYTGEVRPMRVHNLKGVLTPDNMEYTLTWTAPTEGQDSGYVDFDNLKYDIYKYNSSTYDYDSLTTVGHAFQYTYKTTPADGLKTVRLAVFARSNAGVSQDDFNWADKDRIYVMDMVGKPYETPVTETFDNQKAQYGPVQVQYPTIDYMGHWQYQDPSLILADDNKSALVGSNNLEADATIGRVAIAKFSTEDKDSMFLNVKVLSYESQDSLMRFYVRKYGDNDPLNLTKLGDVLLDTISGTKWMNVEFRIPDAYLHQPWIQIVVDTWYPAVVSTETNYIYAIDGYTLSDEHLTTGIKAVTTPTAIPDDPSAPLYNLAGQRVSRSYKGIVVSNGRKFINK